MTSDIHESGEKPESVIGQHTPGAVDGSERFEHRPMTFVGVAGAGTLVYVGVADRAQFDKINLPCDDHGENENGHVLVKTLGGMRASEVTVIFQHWIKSLTVEAFMAQRQRAKATGSTS